MSDYTHHRDDQASSSFFTNFLAILLILLMLGGGFGAYTFLNRKRAAEAAALEAKMQAERLADMQAALAKMEAFREDPETGKLSKVSDAQGKRDPDVPDIGEFELTERSGRKVSNKDLLGKPWAVCFVFTRCAGQCLTLTANMAKLQSELNGAPVRLVTITVDPKFDSPEVLQNYADNFGADPDGWLFLTGEHEYVYRLLRGYFRQIVKEMTGEERKKGFEVLHTSDVLHVSADGNIVKKYNGMDPADMTRLRRALLEEVEQLAKNPAAGADQNTASAPAAVAEKPAGVGKDG